MATNGKQSPIKALIVEDEFLIAVDLEELVKGLGFEVCGVVSNAKSAMAVAMAQQPDLVLMDVYLGGAREGIEAARWMRDVCDTSVVFVTAHNDRDTLERIREVAPESPVLGKPVYPENLAEAVSHAIH